jgi:hypothetical protein
MKLTKTYLYNMYVGNFYQFRVFKVVDAHKQVYYIGDPVARGVTKLADTIEELRKKLESEVYFLNKYYCK